MSVNERFFGAPLVFGAWDLGLGISAEPDASLRFEVSQIANPDSGFFDSPRR